MYSEDPLLCPCRRALYSACCHYRQTCATVLIMLLALCIPRLTHRAALKKYAQMHQPRSAESLDCVQSHGLYARLTVLVRSFVDVLEGQRCSCVCIYRHHSSVSLFSQESEEHLRKISREHPWKDPRNALGPAPGDAPGNTPGHTPGIMCR